MLKGTSIHELRLLAVIDGDRKAEAKLHDRFAACRVKGEWFKACPELMDYISSLPKPPAEAVKRSRRFRTMPEKEAYPIWHNREHTQEEALALMPGWGTGAARKYLGLRNGTNGRPRKKDRTDKRTAMIAWGDRAKYLTIQDALSSPHMKGWSQSAATRRPPKGLGPRGGLTGRLPKPQQD